MFFEIVLAVNFAPLATQNDVGVGGLSILMNSDQGRKVTRERGNNRLFVGKVRGSSHEYEHSLALTPAVRSPRRPSSSTLSRLTAGEGVRVRAHRCAYEDVSYPARMMLVIISAQTALLEKRLGAINNTYG